MTSTSFPVGPRGGVQVPDVVGAVAREEGQENLVDDLRIDERAIRGDLGDDVGADGARRFDVAVEQVLGVSSVERDAFALSEADDRVVL
jgi:hypothetical protein